MRKLLTLLVALGMLLSLQVSFVGAQDLVTHEVQAGETAESIAEAYGVTVEALLAANDLESPDQVVEGVILAIPPADEPAGEEDRGEEPAAADEPADEPVDEEKRGEEPAAEEPADEPADEPVDEEKRGEEPAAEEPADEPADEPVDEEDRGEAEAPADEPVDEPEEVVTPDDIGVAAWISPGSGSTDVFVQNADANTGNPAIDAIAEYIGPGCSAGACTATKNVEPLASQEFLASAAPVGDGWQGSMIVSSGGGALAVAQTNWSGGNRYGAYTGFNQGCTEVYLPILFKLDGKQNSGFAVQNTTTSDGVPVYINLYDGADGALDHQIVDTLDAGEEVYYSVTDYPQIGFVGGSALITSTHKIAAVADTHWGGSNPDYSAMYSGYCSGQTTLNQPVQYRLYQDGGWWTFSAIIVQNTSPDDVAHVTLTYYNGVTGAQDMAFTADIQPNASRGFNTMNGGTVPASTFDPLVGTGSSSAPWWGGSVVISSDVPIVGIGNTLWYAEEKSAQFGLAGANESANALYFPLMQRSGGSWSNWSAALVQNLSTSNVATVNLNFYDRSGNLDLTFAADIEPSSGRGFNTKTGGTVPATTFDPLGNDWYGSLYVTSNQPVIGSAQMIFGNDSSAYNAMIAP